MDPPQANPSRHPNVRGLPRICRTPQPSRCLLRRSTNAAKLYHHVTPGQKIHYIDYTSLYPWVNKTCVYLKGHPQFISQPGHTNIDDYFGFVQCQVLPRVNCTIPCTCVQEEMGKPLLKRSYQCARSVHERALNRTWCTPKLQKAVELGYESTSTRCGISQKPVTASSKTTSTPG